MSEKNTDNKKTGKKRGLGRGLNALIGADVEIASEENEKKAENPVQAAVVLLDIRKIDPDSAQPRKNFDDEALEELADSIKAHGILQPLIVQKKDEDRYQIIAGERRWRAAKKAGIMEIPALVKEYAPEEMLEISLIENIQRENLNPVEEAKAYRRLVEEYSLKQEEIAKRVGKNRTTITNSLRLLGLDDEVLSYLVSKDLSAGHAKALLSVRSKERQIALARKAVKEGMSVRKLEALVQEKPKQIALVEPLNPAEEIVYKDITRTLQNALGTKVSIVRGPKKSKIEIEYYSEEELELLSQR